MLLHQGAEAVGILAIADIELGIELIDPLAIRGAAGVAVSANRMPSKFVMVYRFLNSLL